MGTGRPLQAVLAAARSNTHCHLGYSRYRATARGEFIPGSQRKGCGRCSGCRLADAIADYDAARSELDK